MSDTWDALEAKLAQAYTQQCRHYDTALAVMEHQQNATPLQLAAGAWVQDLQAALVEVTKIDAAIAADKATWVQANRAPGPALRSVVDELAVRIRSLSEQVDRCFAILTERRKQMLPEVDAFIRQRRMFRAYGSHSA